MIIRTQRAKKPQTFQSRFSSLEQIQEEHQVQVTALWNQREQKSEKEKEAIIRKCKMIVVLLHATTATTTTTTTMQNVHEQKHFDWSCGKALSPGCPRLKLTVYNAAFQRPGPRGWTGLLHQCSRLRRKSRESLRARWSTAQSHKHQSPYPMPGRQRKGKLCYELLGLQSWNKSYA